MRPEWVLVAKAVVGTGLTMLAVFVWRTPWVEGLAPAPAMRWFVGSLLVTRLGLFMGLFWLAGARAGSDVAAYYYPQAVAVLAGQVPHRDFQTNYGPAFPCLAVVPVSRWDASESLVPFAIALELLARPAVDSHRPAAGWRAFRHGSLPAPALGETHAW